MLDWLLWITRMENSKVVALLLFFSAFCLVLIYLFANKRRGERLESYKYIPFQEEDAEQPRHPEVEKNERRES
jgi:cbb3-type cytochrome oxidase subunit 3